MSAPVGMSTIRREEHTRLVRIEAEHDRCLDLLADIPGATLPDRLTKLIGEWLAYKLQEGAAEALGVRQEVTPRGYCPAGATGGDGVVFRVGDTCKWVDPSENEYDVLVLEVRAAGWVRFRYGRSFDRQVADAKWEALVLHKRAQS